jgi:hypothetical protein
MNLVENDPLGRVVAPSIWQVIASSNQLPLLMLSMNPLSRSLFNRDDYHSYPAKGIHD